MKKFLALTLHSTHRPVLVSIDHIVTVTKAAEHGQQQAAGTLVHVLGAQVHVSEDYDVVRGMIDPVKH